MAKKETTLRYEVLKGLWDDNPVLRQMLGMCPTLAVSNSAINGMAMGLATTFVLIGSSMFISLLRKIIPYQVRIAGYIVIIAAFVTIADKYLAAFYPLISKSLGPYVPLIVVNCIILGRAEAFAAKNPLGRSILDSLGMGLGFLAMLLALGSVREILGTGTLFGITVLGDWFNPWMVMILPPGAFLGLGCFIALSNWINARRQKS